MRRTCSFNLGVLLPLLIGLAGCGSSQHFATNLVAPLKTHFKPTQITKQQIAAVPYANMLVTLESGQQALLVLAHAVGEERHWLSGSREMLITQLGQVIRSTGLQQNVIAMRYTSRFNPLIQGLGPIKQPIAAHGTLSLMPGYRMELPFKAHFTPVGNERINIGNTALVLAKIKQTLTVPALHWTVHNFFWVDRKNNVVWQAEQQLTPDTPRMRMTVQKPYSKDV